MLFKNFRTKHPLIKVNPAGYDHYGISRNKINLKICLGLGLMFYTEIAQFKNSDFRGSVS